MKLKAKFILLFLFLSLTVYIAVQLNQSHFRKDCERIAYETIKKDVDLYVEHEEQELNYLLDTYSDMPELAMAIKQEKVMEPVLLPLVKNNDISIVWLFDKNRKLLSSVSDLPNYEVDINDICLKSFKTINRGKKSLYHISKDYGLIEIQGVKLKKSVFSDKEVHEEDLGFLFLGRCFDEAYIHDFEKFVGSKLVVNNSNKAVKNATYTKQFYDNNYNVVGGISIFSNGNSLDQILKEELRSSYLILAIIFIYIITYIFLFSNWVIKPLSLLINSLKKDDKSSVIELSKVGGEMGELAKIIVENSENNRKLIASFEEKKVYEKELQLFRFTMNQAQDSISWVDINGRIIEVNDTYCKELKIKKEEAIGTYFWEKNEMVRQEDWNSLWNSIKFLKTYTKEYCQQCCNTSELVYFENISVYIDYYGKEYIVNYRKNITKRKIAENELSKVLQEFENKTFELEKINSSLKVEVQERKAAVEAMAESEEKFKSIFEQSGDGMFLIENDKFIDCNKSALRILGLKTKEDLIDRYPSEISPEFQENGNTSVSESAIHILNANRKGYDNFEWLHTNTSNQIVSVEVTLTSIPRRGKKVIFAAMRDISGRKIIESELKKVSEELDRFFNVAIDLQAIADQNGYFKRINLAFEKILGFSKEVLLSKPFIDFVHPEDISDTTEAMKLLKEQKEVVGFVNRYLCSNGNYRWLEWHTIPVGDLIYCSARDITEKKHAEDTLRQSEEKYRTLINTSPDGITITDLESNILYISINSCKMFGYNSPDEVKNKKLFDFIHPDDLERVSDTLVDMFNGIYRGIGEFRGIKKDGSVFYFEANGEFVKDVNGNPTEIFYISRDISKRKEIEQELINSKLKAEESNKAKSEFFANISHEIRTPLNAIMGFSEVLMSKLNESPQYLDYLNGINLSGKNLLSIINDILDLSKIEAGKFEINNHSVNIQAVFVEVKYLFSLKTTEKNLEFIIEIDKDLPKVVVIDEIRLRQLLFNFVGNAVKFTHKGFIKLSLKGIENENSETIDLQIEIEDSGIGIDKSQFEVIFKPFLQHERQNNRKYGGTGLGLTIAKRLVEMMNGEIIMESTLGVGSKFIIILRDIRVGSESDLGMIDSGHYSLKENAINLNLNTEFNIENINKNLLKKLKIKVDYEILPAYQIAKKTMAISKILDLANLMIEIGKQLKVDFVLNYGNELLQGANNFKVGKIINILEKLEIDLMKIIKNEK